MEEEFCRDCRRETPMVLDYSSGDTICTECGLVSQSHIVDERPEWRVFEGDDETEKVRVGLAGDPLLGGNDLYTTIDKAPASTMRLEAHVRGSNEKHLSISFNEIRRIADRISLRPYVQDRACELYKDAQEVLKGRNKEAGYVACLSLASQQEGDAHWSIKAIAPFCNASVKEINKAKSRLVQHFNGTTKSSCSNNKQPCNKDDAPAGTSNQQPISSTLYIENVLRKFCSSLNMNVKALRAAREITQTVLESLDIRRSPISIAAACMHIAAMYCDPSVSISHIAAASNTSEDTIRKTYKQLHPFLDRIVPQWVITGAHK